VFLSVFCVLYSKIIFWPYCKNIEKWTWFYPLREFFKKFMITSNYRQIRKKNYKKSLVLNWFHDDGSLFTWFLISTQLRLNLKLDRGKYPIYWTTCIWVFDIMFFFVNISSSFPVQWDLLLINPRPHVVVLIYPFLINANSFSFLSK